MTCNWFLEPDKSLGLGPWRAGHIQSKVATMNNVFVGRIRRCICSKGLCSARCIRNWLLTLVDSFGEFYDSGLTCTRILIVTTDIVILKDTRRDYATNTFRCLVPCTVILNKYASKRGKCWNFAFCDWNVSKTVSFSLDHVLLVMAHQRVLTPNLAKKDSRLARF